MASTVTLSQMVDLALGTPEVGAVNFNVLNTLLHTLLGKLDLGNVNAEVSAADRDYLKRLSEEADDARSVADSGVAGMDRSKSAASDKGSSSIRQLENKVSKLESQIDALNQLPSNSELFDQARSSETKRPVSDMWQSMQLSRKVDANEEGVSKLMSLVEDLMKELDAMKKENEDLKKQMADNLKASSLDDILRRLNELEKMTPSNESHYEDSGNETESRLASRESAWMSGNDFKDNKSQLKEELDNYPPADAFNDYVTWAALEDSLKGLREKLEENMNREMPEPVQIQRVVIEMSSQTEAPSRPSTRPSSARTVTPGPSNELLELLERLGKLTDRHDVLEERVDIIEEELKNKLDKNALEGLSVPDDLLKQLSDMQALLESLKKERDRDSDTLTRLQQAILQLQGELEQLNKTTQQLLEDSSDKQKQIEDLFGMCTKLEENKADKEYVQSEVDVKADKRLVDGKVNRALFDTTCDELNKMINDILGKLDGHEDEWKRLMEQLSNDLDGKLDRLEFGPFKDDLERQLKMLLKKLNGLSCHTTETEDDAAGIRKQLIQRFHCISCDRPVEMMPQGPIPSIPAPPGLPATRSSRPYTTFELDQIRQHTKSMNSGQQIDVVDLYATTRSCGGGHTLTHPHRRMTKTTQINNLFRDDDMGSFMIRNEEADIQGADGHIYKGRFEKTRFPDLQTAPAGLSPKSPKSGHRPQTSEKQRPTSARNLRPSSAMDSPHPSSPSRPPINEVKATVPSVSHSMDRSSPPPPPRAPAPSEPDLQPPLVTSHEMDAATENV